MRVGRMWRLRFTAHDGTALRDGRAGDRIPIMHIRYPELGRGEQTEANHQECRDTVADAIAEMHDTKITQRMCSDRGVGEEAGQRIGVSRTTPPGQSSKREL